jgi:dipeptidyl aminopeptidase/acylaminoacyl peptidase
MIMRFDVARKVARPLTGFGYLNPAYSRDGKYIAATKTSAFGTDIVVLDGSNGQELLRVTNDGASFAPAWSPKGDGIAFLHLSGQLVDLRLARLEGTAPAWEVEERIDLTEVSDLGPESRPDWFIPSGQLPALPTATPAPSVAAPSTSPAP